MQLSSRNAYSYTIQQSFPLAPKVNIKMVSLRKQDLTSSTWLCFLWFLNVKATQIKFFFQYFILQQFNSSDHMVKVTRT